jgi:hypothetical protein
MKILFTLYCYLLATGIAYAFDPLEENDKIDFVESTEEWQEKVVSIPETYDPEDLQHFTLNGDHDQFTYAIERKSLRTGEDGVTRFVVVIRSKQGAVNSSYEGLRCGHRAYKIYAYGSDQGLTPFTGIDWQTLSKDANDYRATLYEDLICNLLTGQPNPPDSVFQAMREDRTVDTPFINSDRD